MEFVDRIEETERLSYALSREKSSLVVIYGRRRSGKCNKQKYFGHFFVKLFVHLSRSFEGSLVRVYN